MPKVRITELNTFEIFVPAGERLEIRAAQEHMMGKSTLISCALKTELVPDDEIPTSGGDN